MLRALSIAASGGRAMLQQVDTVANNLANVSTVGYKRTRANFADLLYQQIQRAGFGQPGRDQNPTGLFFGTGVKLVSTEKIMTQGALNHTERELDWAIDGEGFYRVILPDQTVAYTRAANFDRDAQGNVVTPQGYLLDPQINIPDNIVAVTVSVTGEVFGFDPNTPDQLQQLGQITLTRFTNPAGLEAVGDNLFRATAASGDPIEGTPGSDPQMGKIRQGFLEESNVDVVQELVNLITAQRAFEINTNSIRAADDILQAVNNLRR
jgi:flagellar basal-body rod protein FlgG